MSSATIDADLALTVAVLESMHTTLLRCTLYEGMPGVSLRATRNCHSDMGVWRIWHPTYGIIHDELEAMRRGKYASQETRAAPEEGAGRALWATSNRVP